MHLTLYVWYWLFYFPFHLFAPLIYFPLFFARAREFWMRYLRGSIDSAWILRSRFVLMYHARCDPSFISFCLQSSKGLACSLGLLPIGLDILFVLFPLSSSGRAVLSKFLLTNIGVHTSCVYVVPLRFVSYSTVYILSAKVAVLSENNSAGNLARFSCIISSASHIKWREEEPGAFIFISSSHFFFWEGR